MSIIEAREAVPEHHQLEWGLRADARSLGIAEHAIQAAVHAAQAVVDFVDAGKGIASDDAAFESAVAAAVAAADAVDGIQGGSGFRDPEFGDVHDEARDAPHLVEFWNALEQDVRFLEGEPDQDDDWTKVLVSLTERSLWPSGMPVWAGRQWADLKDDLPEAEGWSDWIEWYEERLTGRRVDGAREFARVVRSDDGPGHTARRDGETAKDTISVRGALSAQLPDSPEEVADEEWRCYTDEELRFYITARQFRALSAEEQIAHMLTWFRRMYEDPVNETPRDSEEKDYLYLWGGPFNARDELWEEFGAVASDEAVQGALSEIEREGIVDWAPTSSNPKHQGRRDEEEEDDFEPPPPMLEEIRDRLDRGVSTHFGDPLEAQARQALLEEMARLRDALEAEPPRHGGIGHNRPPESLSLSVELSVKVRAAVDAIHEETEKSVPDVEAVVESTGRLWKVLGWLREKLDMSVNAFVTTLGALVAGGVAADFAGVSVWEHIGKVYWVALKWLDAALPLF